jgi:hypothetical protein
MAKARKKKFTHFISSVFFSGILPYNRQKIPYVILLVIKQWHDDIHSNSFPTLWNILTDLIHW